jgi:hypothetical protein
MPQNDPLAAAKATLAGANKLTSTVNAVAPPAPPKSLDKGVGHNIGVAFAAVHGNNHDGTVAPNPLTQLMQQANSQGHKAISDRDRNMQQNPDAAALATTPNH